MHATVPASALSHPHDSFVSMKGGHLSGVVVPVHSSPSGEVAPAVEHIAALEREIRALKERFSVEQATAAELARTAGTHSDATSEQHETASIPLTPNLSLQSTASSYSTPVPPESPTAPLYASLGHLSHPHHHHHHLPQISPHHALPHSLPHQAPPLHTLAADVIPVASLVVATPATAATATATAAIPHRTPGPTKGVGSKSKSSCHQCKSSKPDSQLLFCTNRAKDHQRKRRCRKKYCFQCLKRCYPACMPPENGEKNAASGLPEWICPSCAHICQCASCSRKGLGAASIMNQQRSAAHGSGGEEYGQDEGEEGDDVDGQHELPSRLPPHPHSAHATLTRNLQAMEMHVGRGLNFETLAGHLKQTHHASATEMSATGLLASPSNGSSPRTRYSISSAASSVPASAGAVHTPNSVASSTATTLSSPVASGSSSSIVSAEAGAAYMARLQQMAAVQQQLNQASHLRGQIEAEREAATGGADAETASLASGRSRRSLGSDTNSRPVRRVVHSPLTTARSLDSSPQVRTSSLSVSASPTSKKRKFGDATGSTGPSSREDSTFDLPSLVRHRTSLSGVSDDTSPSSGGSTDRALGATSLPSAASAGLDELLGAGGAGSYAEVLENERKIAAIERELKALQAQQLELLQTRETKRMQLLQHLQQRGASPMTLKREVDEYDGSATTMTTVPYHEHTIAAKAELDPLSLPGSDSLYSPTYRTPGGTGVGGTLDDFASATPQAAASASPYPPFHPLAGTNPLSSPIHVGSASPQASPEVAMPMTQLRISVDGMGTGAPAPMSSSVRRRPLLASGVELDRINLASIHAATRVKMELPTLTSPLGVGGAAAGMASVGGSGLPHASADDTASSSMLSPIPLFEAGGTTSPVIATTPSNHYPAAGHLFPISPFPFAAGTGASGVTHNAGTLNPFSPLPTSPSNHFLRHGNSTGSASSSTAMDTAMSAANTPGGGLLPYTPGLSSGAAHVRTSSLSVGGGGWAEQLGHANTGSGTFPGGSPLAATSSPNDFLAGSSSGGVTAMSVTNTPREPNLGLGGVPILLNFPSSTNVSPAPPVVVAATTAAPVPS